MPPLQLQTLYGEQIAAISDAVILLLMADTKGITYTHLTYSLRSESVLMLLVLAGSQLTQPLGGSGVLDPLIDNLMQRPTREASALMTALLTHYTDMAAEPSVPRVPTGGFEVPLLGASIALSATMSLQPHQYAQLQAKRGNMSAVRGGGAPLSERCAWLLLVLLNYRSTQKKPNPYVDLMQRMCDSDSSNRRAQGAAGSDEDHVLSVSFSGLHDGVVTGLRQHVAYRASAAGLPVAGSAGTVLLLYVTLHTNHSFLNFLLAKSEPEGILGPLLAILYSHAATSVSGSGGGAGGVGSVADPVVSASTYILLVVLLILSNDAIYCANLHAPECSLANVDWYRERVLSEVSVGSLAVVVLVRALQSNLRQQDAYIGRTCLAVLCNMAPHASNLHPYAAQRVLYLYEVLSKRSLALRKRLRLGQDGGTQHVAAADSVEMLAVCLELRLSTLELLRLLLTHGVARNPHLIYALIHKRQVFDKYSAEAMSQGAGVESVDAGDPGLAREAEALRLIDTVTHSFSAHVEAALNHVAGAPADKSSTSAVPNPQHVLTPSKHGLGAGEATQAATPGLPEAPATPSTPATQASGAAFCSVDRVVGLIKEAAQSSLVMQQIALVMGATSREHVKYQYEEDEEPHLFFTPYLWSQILLHSQTTCNMRWNAQRLLLFTPNE